MTWHDERMVAFDLETTGVDPETARIVTATVVWVSGRQVEKREWLVNPGVPIPAEAAAIHGITDERAKAEGIHPATAVAQIFSELDDAWTGHHPVVIFNASYDLTVLDRELRRHCGTALDGVIGPVIDPFVIDKHLDPYRKGKRTLTACSEHYKVALTDAHTATGDALAAARLAWRLAQVYPEQLGDLTVVNERQAAWRASWAADFEAYLRRQGKDEHVDGAWPVRPFVGAMA
jgi:DNA polymerase-3 subunit epsilon